MLEEPRPGIANRGKLEHRSNGEQVLRDCNAESRVQHRQLVPHCGASRCFAEPGFQVLPNALLGNVQRSRLSTEEPLEVVKRLLSATERAITLSLIVAFEPRAEIKEGHAIGTTNDLSRFPLTDALAQESLRLRLARSERRLAEPLPMHRVVQPPTGGLAPAHFGPEYPALASHRASLVSEP